MNAETNVSTETTSAANPVTGARKAPKKVGKAAGKPAKAAKAGKQAKSTGKQESASSGSGTPLKAICKELKIEPKLARRKLRAAKLDFHGHRERWTFTGKQAAKVREILA